MIIRCSASLKTEHSSFQVRLPSEWKRRKLSRKSVDLPLTTDGNQRTNNAKLMQMQCKCNANASDLQCNTDANASLNKSKVKESKVKYNTSPRTRESASAPSEEEVKELYEFFFWRNLKDPSAEFMRFIQHNEKYGWKLNDTAEKRKKAASEWIPEEKGERVSQKFLDAWSALYYRLKIEDPVVAKEMLQAGCRLSVNNGAVVIHAHGAVQNYIRNHYPEEIAKLANGNPIRFSWP